VITALTLCPVLSHTNAVYGALHCALLLMITTPAQKKTVLSLREGTVVCEDYGKFVYSPTLGKFIVR